MRKNVITFTGIFLFLLTFALSIVLESPVILYIASGIPLCIVPFIPDIKSNQVIRPGKDKDHLKMVRLVGSDKSSSDLLIISFTPGYIQWNKKFLCFKLEDIPTVSSVSTDEYTAAVTVLKFDLRVEPKKGNRVGIYLPHLIERTTNLPYTINEVNRLTVCMEDIREHFIPNSISVPASGDIKLRA